MGIAIDQFNSYRSVNGARTTDQSDVAQTECTDWETQVVSLYLPHILADGFFISANSTGVISDLSTLVRVKSTATD